MQLWRIKHGDSEEVDLTHRGVWCDARRRRWGMRSNLNMESSRWVRANRRYKALNALSLTLITQSCETYLIQNAELIYHYIPGTVRTPVETVQDVRAVKTDAACHCLDRQARNARHAL